jgi:hypothetical protein
VLLYHLPEHTETLKLQACRLKVVAVVVVIVVVTIIIILTTTTTTTIVNVVD